MQNNLVSVVMAVHNVEKYIIDALTSVQKQTYKDFECIIVDDHSTDDTANIIYNMFCRKDSRFKLYLNCTDKDNPYIDAHNVSYRLGKGKYLIRFDGDDIMLENHIETIVKVMDEHPEYDAVCTCVDRKILNKDGVLVDYATSGCNITSGWERREKESLTEENIKNFNTYPDWQYKENTLSWFNQASAIRKTFYDLKQPKFDILRNGDYVFWWQMLSMGAKLHKIKDVTLIYRMHRESICHSVAFSAQQGPCYDFQIALASYKAKSFNRYPAGTIFPDGTESGKVARVFERTRQYFIEEKRKHEA